MDMDSLQIGMSADNSKAIQSIDALCRKLGALNTQLTKGLNVSNYTQSINNLNSAINTFDGNKATQMANSVNGFVKAFSKFSNKKPMMAAQSITAISTGFKDLASSLSGVNFSSQTQSLIDLTSSISKLGGKSTERAITNMPLLTKEIRAFFDEMSKAPMVSDNTIRMTNALSNLAAQGGKVGSATSGLRRFFNYNSNNSINGFKGLFNTITSGGTKSSKSVKSLAYYFGKLYANYFLFMRMFGGLKKSINYASDLTEIQNVVDNVFGDATQKVEEFSKTAIEDFGMSILTTKKVASEYQAMANAMGITNEQVKESNKTWSLADQDINKTANAYNNAASSVADMSLNLTKLAADMGSFYNQEYDQVAERLASGVMTGQTRVLRQYGLDLTQATLKEWALTQGIEANFKTMTQAEKTMLRYQYVMSRTQNIQGDFLRTSMSWANVVRVLAQNFQNLGATIGGIGINAFRPLLIGINNAILKLNEFAIVVSNSLGKIFGWKYVGGGGSASTELEDMADSADGLAGGLGNAADNAKKLKSQLQGFDQLNVLSSDSGNGSGGSGSGGASGGSGGAGSSNNGGWERTESLFESDLDTLGKLGSYISDKLASSLESIDWDSIYQGARNFGKGLADFLNGLITPRLFYDVGETIANSLNTAIYGSLEFAENFDFRNFGSSIASAINGFFQNFDFGALADNLNAWVDGLQDTVKGFLDTFDWKAVIEGATTFFNGLELDTLVLTIGALAWKLGVGGAVKNSLAALLESEVATGIGSSKIKLKTEIFLILTVASVSFKVGNWLYDNVDSVRNWSDEIGKWIFGEDFNNSKFEITYKSLMLAFGSLGFTIGGVKGSIALANFAKKIVEDLALNLAISAGAEDLTFSAVGKAIGAKIAGAITIDGVGVSLLTLMRTDIAAIAAEGSFAAIGTTIAIGIIGGVTAAIGGWKFGWWLGEKLAGEEYDFEDLANAIRDCFDKELNLSFKGFLDSFFTDLGDTGFNQWIFDNLTTPILDFFTVTIPREWKKFWLTAAYDASEMIQPLLDKIADIGEATGLMSEETVNDLRTFSDGVKENVDKAIKELDGYEDKTDSVKGTTSKNIADMSGLYSGVNVVISRSLQDSRNSLNSYENSVNQAKNTTSTSTTNMNGLYAEWYSNMARIIIQSKASLSGYENAVKGAKNTTSTETSSMSGLYSGLYRNISSNMSAGSTSVKGLGDETNRTKGKVDDLMKRSNQTFNIKTGSGFSSLASSITGIVGGISTIFGFNGKKLDFNIGKKAEGGTYYNGTWHAIPQYASGGSPSHGTMFIAGERGAEAVGHINGRTEVLNQSQMASVMYDAVLSGMSAAMARQGTNRVEVVLQGDAKGIFNAVRKEDRQYKNVNGHSAFGY